MLSFQYQKETGCAIRTAKFHYLYNLSFFKLSASVALKTPFLSGLENTTF